MSRQRFEAQEGLPLWCKHCKRVLYEHDTTKRFCPPPSVRASEEDTNDT